MSEYDPQRPDSYAVHLANISSSDGVIATRDIHNEQGILLVKKGHAIKTGTANLLLNHKLVQPLETSISISDAIDAEQLFTDLSTMLRGDKESQVIHQTMGLNDILRQQCTSYMAYPLIAQKVTVLSLRLKPEYDKAIFCAWFSLALAVQMRTTREFIEEAFIAGLVHDTGLLHIDPGIAGKTGDYTPEEWRAVQSHTLIADLFLSYVDNLPPNIRRAVREHHERCDGSGYPAALYGDKLDLLGQIVGMADTVWAICKKPVGRKGVSLADVITVARMNKEQHPAQVESALYHLHRCTAALGELPIQLAVNADTRSRLLKLGRQLHSGYRIVDRLRGILSPSDADRVLRSAYVKLERLWFAFNGSGLLAEQISQWLELGAEAGEQKTDYDLHQLSLMYGEFYWQLFQLARSLQQVLDHAKSLDQNSKLIVESVLDVLRPLLIDGSLIANKSVAQAMA